MARPRIIIIDEETGQQIGTRVKAMLQQESSYQVDLIEGMLPDVKEILQTHPELIIPVLPASKERAEQLLGMLRAKGAYTPLLPVVRAEDLTQMLDGLLLGTKDFLVTPLREAEVLARIQRLLPRSRHEERDRAREQLAETFGLELLLGEDPAFVAVKRKIPLVARSEVPVLLTGETGTGKEMCARAIHYLSRRAGKPFLPVNCGAIPVELFENELFGHQRGAFTSAWTAQPGLIAEAEGGTLFLDESDTLSPGAQVKLLRFLQDQTYHALGSPRLRQADVWVIAATNVELSQRVREGSFREDLFYRLGVITLALPALRERRTDIPLLATHFLARYAGLHGREPRELSPRAVEALCHYSWPGNIRELENVIQQAIVLTEAPTIEPEHLPIPPPPPSGEAGPDSFKRAKSKVIEQFEKAYVTELLGAHQGNVTHAARGAGMERRTFGRLIKKHRIAKR